MMAASIRLRVGLGGSDTLPNLDGPSLCSGRRVFVYLMLLDSPRVGSALAAVEML